MEKLNEHVLIALTDHIAFSAENINNGIVIRNKLLREIEVLYSDEFSIAQWAVEYLTKELGIPYTYDEAGYIAIHIHSGRSGRNNNHRSIREVTIVSDIIHLGIRIGNRYPFRTIFTELFKTGESFTTASTTNPCATICCLRYGNRRNGQTKIPRKL